GFGRPHGPTTVVGAGDHGRLKRVVRAGTLHLADVVGDVFMPHVERKSSADEPVPFGELLSDDLPPGFRTAWRIAMRSETLVKQWRHFKADRWSFTFSKNEGTYADFDMHI